METTEKVSVNMNIATISQIDLLVDEGYFSNRSDFINQAVRQVLDQKTHIIEGVRQRKSDQDHHWFIGIAVLGNEDFLRAKKKQVKMKISGYGLLVIQDVPDELVIEAVESIKVKGKIVCSDKVREQFLSK